ncbi:hypothetical protein HD806DRAFT_496221 [Xylariaceae sp. AK1471]|nr:hypothetical protein HD806DRAFT_496221 [Xylariaceae sp. AK1471]
MLSPSIFVIGLFCATLFGTIHASSTFKPNCTLPPPDTRYVSGPNTRGTLTIFWNSLSIILLCTWSIQHLNVPAGRRRTKSILQRLWWNILDLRRKTKWMFFTILVPEYIFGKALNDRFAAKYETKKMKEDIEIHDWTGVEWEEVHSHMANLGYFVLHFSESLDSLEPMNDTSTHPHLELKTNTEDNEGVLAGIQTSTQFESTNLENEYGRGLDIAQKTTQLACQRQFGRLLEQIHQQQHRLLTKSGKINLMRLRSRYWVLNAEEWRMCILMNIADLPKASVRDLEKLDRGGGFVKILALIQVSYLIVQLIVRKISGLSCSQLEITALAFASSSFVTYIILWGRPQGVESIQIVEAKSIPDWGSVFDIVVHGPGYLWTKYRTSSRLDDDFEFAPIPNDASHIVLSLPWYLSTYAGTNDELVLLALGSIAGGSLFGGVHCLAWNLHFPTLGEAIAWRICSIIISVLPLISIVPLSIWTQMHPSHWNDQGETGLKELGKIKWSRFVIGTVLIGGCLIPYVLARLFLIYEIFRTLFFLPPDAFIDTWSLLFPHWG